MRTSSNAGVRRFLLGGLLLGVLSGCGASTATVKGKVTFDKKPMSGGKVVFATRGKESMEYATIDADGNYKAERLPYGTYLIGVQPADKSPADMMPKKSGLEKIKMPEGAPQGTYGQGSGVYVNIPNHFRDPEMSKLTVTVDSSEKTFDIDVPAK